jgi:hypothetical protein
VVGGSPFNMLRANGGGRLALQHAQGERWQVDRPSTGSGRTVFPFGLRIFPFGLSLSKPSWKALVLAPFDKLRANGGRWIALRQAKGERFFRSG